MPKTIEVLTGEVRDIVSAKGTLASVRNILADIDDLLDALIQADVLANGQLTEREEYRAISNLKESLRILVTPTAQKKAARLIVSAINKSLDPKYNENLFKKINESKSRSYIPQRFLGMANTSAMSEELAIEYSFVATTGLGPCVGFVLYSPTSKTCVLAHIDDEFDVTGPIQAPENMEHATNNYKKLIRNARDQTKIGSTSSIDDWEIILMPSRMPQSQTLADIINNAALGLVSEVIISPQIGDTRENTRSILLNLKKLHSDGTISETTYPERIDFSAIPPNTLSMRQVLNIPEHGFRLYQMTNGDLIEQDLNAGFEMRSSYVIPKALPTRTPTNDRPQESSASYVYRSFRACCQSMRNCFRTGSAEERTHLLGSDSENKDNKHGPS